MTIAELQREFLSAGTNRIAPADFFILLAQAARKDKVFLLSHPEYELEDEGEMHARDFFTRRLRSEPVAYILGRKEFFGLDFEVTRDTLIPRPETEALVERALNEAESGIRNQESGSGRKILIADIGTGSGNIIISIASELMKSPFSILHSQFTLHATDISDKAIAIAKKNAARHGVSGIIGFRTGDLLAPIGQELLSADEIIIAANLPYLSREIYSAADDDVKAFEPPSALISDQAGLDHYVRLLDQANSLLKPVTLFLEISPEQTPLLRAHLASRFPRAEISIHQDLSGRDRIAQIALSSRSEARP